VVAVIAAIAGVPAPVAVVIGMAVGGACGLVNGVLTAYLALAPFIVTLGTMTFLRGLAYTITNGQPIVSSDLNFKDLGNGYLLGIPVPVIAMVAVFLVAWFVLERTRYGRHVYAVGGNAQAARLAGVQVNRIILSVYVVAGICAGLAGVIFAARVISAQPTAGTGYELDAIAAVVLGGTSLVGGRGRIVGTLIGAVILGVLTTGLILLNVQFFTQLLIKGVVIILAVAIDSLKQRPELLSVLFGRGQGPSKG
jgi:ribose transport system permease protein